MTTAGPFPYKKTLIVGATSGIGEALAIKLIAEGCSVVVVGRREDRLDAFIRLHGSDRASAVPFDIVNASQTKDWVEDVVAAHRNLDCVVLNAGIQRQFDFSEPASVDLKIVEEEFNLNYLAQVRLAMAFLPHLQHRSHTTPSAMVFTTSGLALVPAARVANYSASKAALHHWILSFRQQLRDKGSEVKVIELIPPAVRTELHEQQNRPGLENIRAQMMPLEQFIEETWAGLQEGKEQVGVGPIAVNALAEGGFEAKRQEVFEHLDQLQKKSAPQESN